MTKRIAAVIAGAMLIGASLFAAAPAHAGGYDPEVDCTSAGFGTGRALTNGDHINMDIVQNGQKFQLNAYVDRNVQGGFDTLGIRINGHGSIPLTEAQVKAGALVFDYSSYLPSTKPHKVEWVQFNSSYFNQNRDPGKVLNCGEEPPVVPEKPEPVVTVKADETVKCDDKVVLIRETTTSIDWKLVNNVWVQDEPVVSVKDSTRPATAQECPLPEIPDVGMDTGQTIGLIGGAGFLLTAGGILLALNRRKQQV